MQKSIFAKYFTITACLLTACFVVLGGLLLVFTKNQWKTDKHQLLSNNVNTIADFSENIISEGINYKSEIGNTVVVISQIIGADIYVTDTNGNCILCNDEFDNCRHKQHAVSEEILEKALVNDASFTGNMGGIYSSQCYTVSKPIFINGSAAGAVFATVPMAGANVAVAQMFKMILICSLLIMLFAFFAIYLISSTITRPLRQMAAAARNMENGEFTQIPAVKRKDEIGLLVEAFNRMSKSLSQLEGMRRSFISSVSHELKTPMTTMSGFIDGMLDGTIPPENYDKYLQIVSDETKRLARLVNSMLQLSRLENEDMKLNYSTFNVTDLLVRIMLSFEAKIEGKQIEIRGLEDTTKIMLCADSDLMYQVLYNLVENAIKFTPESGYILVSVHEDKHNSNVKIEITNSGEGLNSVELSRIFERFYKTDRSRSTDKTGMGFGLYIVKTIVGLHGGQINAESVINEYTKFTVILPNEIQTPQITQVPHDDNSEEKQHRLSSKFQKNKTDEKKSEKDA